MSALHGSALLLPPAARNPRPHDWGLLNSTTFISDLRNETTAGTLTAAGLTIQVSFVFADPPRLSYFCVYCLDHRNEIAFANAPKVVSSAEDTALIRVMLTTEKSLQHFLYRARGPKGVPSLDLLPDIRQYSLTEIIFRPLGFVSHDNSTQLVMAALSYGPSNGQYYNLHTICSEQYSTWSKKLLRVEIPDGLPVNSAVIHPNKVISLGGGLLGWVDLWKGIVICDVLNPGAVTASFVPMPKLLPSNNELYSNQYSARPIRDVTFSGGYIKCVEFEELVKLRPTTLPADPWDRDELQDSELAISPPQEEEEVYDVVGWRLITWYRALTWNGWRKGSMVHSDDLGTVSLPQVGGGACARNVPFNKLKTASPTLRGDDVVYLVSMWQEDDQDAWIVTVDTKRKSVGEVMPFSAEGSLLYNPTFIPCVLRKYLDAKSVGAQAGKRDASHVPHSGNFNKLKKQREAELEEQQPVPQLLQHKSAAVLMPLSSAQYV
uniref:Uncharacterized protein n=1 Tax=Avena sativa TaxID=4498 RepID=A0ACD5X9Y1_AVESA